MQRTTQRITILVEDILGQTIKSNYITASLYKNFGKSPLVATASLGVWRKFLNSYYEEWLDEELDFPEKDRLVLANGVAIYYGGTNGPEGISFVPLVPKDQKFGEAFVWGVTVEDGKNLYEVVADLIKSFDVGISGHCLVETSTDLFKLLGLSDTISVQSYAKFDTQTTLHFVKSWDLRRSTIKLSEII